MTDHDSLAHKVFFEIHSDLPRQCGGSDASTLTALDLVQAGLPDAPQIADLGCGPGAASLVLLKALPTAHVYAVDLHAPFLAELKRRADSMQLSHRLAYASEDMLALSVEPESLDLIWCEGAIYNCGVERSLKAWRSYLKPGGLVVFNEIVWLLPETDRPTDLANFWRAYPAMTDVDGVRGFIDAAGYKTLGEFNLPDSDWWESYYSPMGQRLDRLEAVYAGVKEAEDVLAGARQEIDLRRRYPEACTYRYFAVELIGDA